MSTQQLTRSTASPTIRINKLLAQSGVASRRGAEELIRSGRVTIDGIPIRTVDQVVPAESVVAVDGKVVQPRRERIVLALHKPPGVVTTVHDPRGRTTILDFLPAKYRDRGLVPVGRLDQDSCGLLLLSNDGNLVHALLHPSHKVWKGYRVAVRGKVTREGLASLRSGVELDGRRTAPARLRLVEQSDVSGGILEMAIREGRRRQIRRMCRQIGLRVTQLKRVAFGPIQLGNLPEGRYRVLSPREISRLRGAGGL